MVFVRILGVDALAFNEHTLTVADAHALQVTRLEAHFHAPLDRFVKHDVRESRWLEVAVGKDVDVIEHVQIERRGNAECVVIRSVETRLVLLGIDSDQKTALGPTSLAPPRSKRCEKSVTTPMNSPRGNSGVSRDSAGSMAAAAMSTAT